MKMTMHIDDALLARVMDIHGIETKTEAVHFALNELDRRSRLREMLKTGLGLSPDELKGGIYEDYDPTHLRVAEPETPYGSKRSD